MSNDWTGLACNGVLLCSPCHAWVESHREDAVAAGWLVAYESDPAAVPVRVFGGRLVLLSVTGHYERAERLVELPAPAGMVPAFW